MLTSFPDCITPGTLHEYKISNREGERQRWLLREIAPSLKKEKEDDLYNQPIAPQTHSAHAASSF
jgi:hypothetical protein